MFAPGLDRSLRETGEASVNRRAFLSRSVLSEVSAAQRAGNTAGGKLLAGASLSNITPALGCSIAGNMTSEIVTGIHDDLHVRSLVSRQRSTRLALATCDPALCPVSQSIAPKS